MIRRDFLKLSVAATPAMVLALNACHGFSGTPQQALASPESLFGIVDRTELLALGKTYLSLFPSSKESLSAQILGSSANPSASGSQVAQQIAQNIQLDFQSGRTIILNGWVLSITEARQCALHTLIYT